MIENHSMEGGIKTIYKIRQALAGLTVALEEGHN